LQLVEVVVRQAHPGERHGSYRSFAEKLEDARRYQEEEDVVWPVLVDDLDGTVQRAYGGLSASAYLIDAEGPRRLLRHVGPSAPTAARGC
jgi:hypothetical protein